MRKRGVDPDDKDSLEDYARRYTKANPVYGGISWGSAAGASGEASDDEDAVAAEAEEISTESMYSMSAWGAAKK